MHRFFIVHSFRTFNRYNVAAAALFLAAKVEEQPQKLEYVARVFYAYMYRDHPNIDPSSEEYKKLIEEITAHELLILETLGFDLRVEHAHPHVVKCTQLVRASKDLSHTAYFMAHNSLLLTTFCLEHRPTVVACCCINLACVWKGIEIPPSEDQKILWWEYVDSEITKELLDSLTKEFLHIYGKSPSKLQKKLTEQIRLTQKQNKLKQEEAGPSGGSQGDRNRPQDAHDNRHAHSATQSRPPSESRPPSSNQLHPKAINHHRPHPPSEKQTHQPVSQDRASKPLPPPSHDRSNKLHSLQLQERSAKPHPPLPHDRPGKTHSSSSHERSRKTQQSHPPLPQERPNKPPPFPSDKPHVPLSQEKPGRPHPPLPPGKPHPAALPRERATNKPHPPSTPQDRSRQIHGSIPGVKGVEKHRLSSEQRNRVQHHVPGHDGSHGLSRQQHPSQQHAKLGKRPHPSGPEFADRKRSKTAESAILRPGAPPLPPPSTQSYLHGATLPPLPPPLPETSPPPPPPAPQV